MVLDGSMKKMKSNILFPQFFLPLTSIKLARFVTSVDHPHQDYHDPPLHNPPIPTVTLREHYAGFQREGEKTGFLLALTSLLSSKFSKQSNTRTRITTSHVRTYALENSSQWFEECMTIESTRKWVEKAIADGDDIYMIVGFHTVVDARIISESVRGREVGGRAGVPVDLSLVAIGAIAPLGNIINPQIDGHHENADGVQAQFLAPGEQICAFQYRKICHRWLSHKNRGTAQLSKAPRWKAYDTWRTSGKSEDTKDTIEVEMVEEEMLNGDWDRSETAEGDILLISRT